MSNENHEKMDGNSLYKEEIITDRRVGSIRVLTPIRTDGVVDNKRNIVYIGQAQLLTPMGAIPMSFTIEADSMADAVSKFSGYANKALEQTAKELQDFRREQASSIVIPGSKDMPLNIPGSGKIQLK